jgi:hypothetical protein
MTARGEASVAKPKPREIDVLLAGSGRVAGACTSALVVSPAHRPRASERPVAAFRQQILERDGYRCYWCGETAARVDHVVPLAHCASVPE